MGIVTATDLDSGRPEKIAAKTGERPEDLLVQDIMTLRGRIEVLRLEDVGQASVGQGVARIKFDGNRYSTPPDYVGKPVTIRAGAEARRTSRSPLVSSK